MPNQKTRQILTTLAVIVSLFLVNQAILAWTAPGASPPSGNAAAPLNIGSTAQTKSGSLAFTIFYDQNNTGYYVDPASNSWLYRLYSYDIRSDIYYDRNNTGYYVDPASTSKFSTINLGGVSRSSWPSGGGTLDCTNVSTGWVSSGTASCPSGYTLTGGSCDMWRGGDCRECSPRYCYPNGNGYYCTEGNTGQCRAHALCCRVSSY